MDRQKNREGYEVAEKREGHGEAKKKIRIWRGRKTEKDMKRQKDREVHGEVKRQRRTWRGRKTEKDMER